MHRWLSVFVLFSTLTLLGCGSSEGTVSGTVKVDGNTLDTGSVTFHPVGGGAAAVGAIEPNGSYTLKTGTSTGVKPGEYIVTVYAAKVTAGTAKEAPKAGKSLVADRYTNPKTSDLKKTVNAGANTSNLELTSK